MQNEKNSEVSVLSFSGKVKEELAKQYSEARHCRLTEIAAILAMCGRVIIDSNDKYSIKIQVENISVARKYFTLLEKTFNIDKDILVSGNKTTVTVENHEDAMRIFQETQESAQHTCCKRAYLRGAFLAVGSMSNPEKAYHLEFVCSVRENAKRVKELIRSFGLEAKIILRKKAYVVYMKEGSQIVDLLNVMEAPVSLMELENVRILKEMRNSVNRKVNCETANINKTVSAAVKQLEDIKYIRDAVGLHELSEGLEEIANLRLQYPEATLKELGELLDPPVGKSGVNHRLRKLSEIAEDLRKNKEE